MKFIRNNIPNAITALNLWLGLLALVNSLAWGYHVTAAWLVIGAAVADFFDGMAARLLKSDNKIGKDLDSLADVVSFGAAPALIYFSFFFENIPAEVAKCPMPWLYQNAPLFLLLIAVFSAIRLARFNNDTRQTDSFIGLPVPANALLGISIPLIYEFQPDVFPGFIMNPWFVIGFSLFSSFMLVSPLPLFALKFKQWGFKGNEVRYIFLALCAVLILTLKFAAIPLIIILYILISLGLTFFRKKES